MSTDGKPCIIPFYTRQDDNYSQQNKCYLGKCATRLNSDGTSRELRACRTGCPGSNNNIL